MIADKITKEELKILDITLLSIEEAKKLPERLREYEDWWWLRSSGISKYYAAYVDDDGSVSSRGLVVCGNYGSVRPALVINLNSSSFKVGDCFIFANKEFEIISENMAFCKSDIGLSRFAEVTNNYETSEIKKYINNWFEN